MLKRIAELVTRHPMLVAGIWVALTAALATQLPPPADPAPEKLLATEENVRANLDQFQSMFQDTDKVLVLLVQARDVLTRPPLQYAHGLTRHFEDADYLKRVLCLTTMQLPREGEEDTEGSLEDLEAELAQEEQETEGEGLDPALIDALHAIVDTDPNRFPGGFNELAGRLSGELLRTDPVVEGNRVTDEDVAELRAAVRASPLIQGRLISEDRSLMVIVLYLDAEHADHDGVVQATEQIQSYLEHHRPPSGVRVDFGGLPYIRMSIVQNVRHDQRTLIPLTLLVSLLVLWLSFRWLPGVLFPLMGAGVVVLVLLGTMSLLGEPMNIINNVIPIYLIIVSITNSIHFIQRYRDAMRVTKDPVESRKIAVQSMGMAQLVTSCTDAVGFCALIISQTIMLRRFGVVAGLGSFIPYFTTITFIAAIMAWARPPPTRDAKVKGKVVERAGRLESIVVLTARASLRRSWLVIGVMLVLLAGLSWVATHITIDHHLLDQFSRSSDVYRSTRLMEQKLDGVRPLDVVVTSRVENGMLDPAAVATLDRVAAWARSQPGVLGTMGHSDVMHETLVLLSDDPSVRGRRFRPGQTEALHSLLTQREPNPLSSFLTDDGKAARLTIKLGDIGSAATLQFAERLQARLRTAFPRDGGFSTAIAGDAYVSSLGLRAVIRDLFGSMFAAIGIIFILLFIRFRSFLLAAIAIPPYVVPLAGTLAYMVVRDIPLNASTLIVFSASIGIAVNGSVHLLQRFEEEIIAGCTPGVAMLRAARGAGRAIVVAGATLMLGFGVMLFSSFIPVRHFGELLAVTLGTCTVGTIVVQPALLHVVGMRTRFKKGTGKRAPVAEKRTAKAS